MQNISLSLKVILLIVCMAFIVPSLSYADCADRTVDKDGWCHPQCVEYVKCKLGISHKGNAATWWTNPPKGYSKQANGSKTKPSKNDIIVWTNIACDKKGKNCYGHVAIVDSVDTKKSKINIKDANFSSNFTTDCQVRNRQLSYTTKSGRYYINGIAGWLVKKK